MPYVYDLIFTTAQVHHAHCLYRILAPEFLFLFTYLDQRGAGTIFAMSGDDIIMTGSSYIGPIDPQVRNKDGAMVPAQSILTLLEDIRERGKQAIANKQPIDWADVQILNRMDHKELGSAVNASDYSIDLVQNFLQKYKLKNWTEHESTGDPVSEEERKDAAIKIAKQFCNHKFWKSHARGITRDTAWAECKLKIISSEDIEGLDSAIRKYWAAVYFLFEKGGLVKMYLSKDYSLFRQKQVLKQIFVPNQKPNI